MDPSLYVILDRAAARGRDLEAILDEALAGGCRMIQLREKEWPAGRLLPVAERLRERCRRAGATFIVNDRVDLALAVDADGVHLGHDDLPTRAARPLLRSGMILGRSTHSLAQAREARDDGAGYIAVGSMFPSSTKPDFQRVGPYFVRTIRPGCALPIIRTGGTTPDNVAPVHPPGPGGRPA